MQVVAHFYTCAPVRICILGHPLQVILSPVPAPPAHILQETAANVPSQTCTRVPVGAAPSHKPGGGARNSFEENSSQSSQRGVGGSAVTAQVNFNHPFLPFPKFHVSLSDSRTIPEFTAVDLVSPSATGSFLLHVPPASLSPDRGYAL